MKAHVFYLKCLSYKTTGLKVNILMILKKIKNFLFLRLQIKNFLVKYVTCRLYIYKARRGQ